MMKDIKENLVKYALYSALAGAAVICIWFIIISSDLGQQLLAFSVLVTIIVGGFINMLKIFSSSRKVDELSEAVKGLYAIEKDRRGEEIEDREEKKKPKKKAWE